jgi:hypothetical protein
MVTLSVAVPEAPAASESDVGEIVGFQLGDALSAVVKLYVFWTLPVFVTVTV